MKSDNEVKNKNYHTFGTVPESNHVITCACIPLYISAYERCRVHLIFQIRKNIHHFVSSFCQSTDSNVNFYIHDL